MVLGGVAILAVVIMWVAAFAGVGSTQSIDRLNDKRWTSAARDVCTEQRAAYDKLPQASDAKTPQDRADTVNSTITIFTTMTDELAAIPPPSTGADADLVTEWLGDCDRHLDDRQRFATQLEQGRKDAVFTESLRDDKQVSRYIDRFARAHVTNRTGVEQARLRSSCGEAPGQVDGLADADPRRDIRRRCAPTRLRSRLRWNQSQR